MSDSFKYPECRRDESVTEELHGKQIADPYRWMEDPDAEEVQKFVEDQNRVTVPFLEDCNAREDIRKRLTDLFNYPKYSCPFKRGNKYYFFKNAGLQNQSVLYVQDSLDVEPTVFLDPNLLSADGTVAISTHQFSKNGEIFAYGLSKSGSDWSTIHFKSTTTGEDYGEVLEKVKFSGITWTHDNKGIFYGRYPEQQGKTDGSETTSNENQKLYYHRIGTPQSEDVLVAEFLDHPKWRIGASVSDCGNYLVVTPQQDCRDNLLFFASLVEPLKSGLSEKLELIPVVTEFEADYEYVTNESNIFYFRTNKNAPNYQVIGIDFNNPQSRDWSTLIAEHSNDVLDWATPVNKDKLVVCYIQDVKNVLSLHKLQDGSLIKHFPIEVGTITGYSGKREHNEMFFQFQSFLTPGTIYHVDFSSPEAEAKVFREVKLEGFDGTKFTTTQVFYPSKDGTKVPMFIVHKKDINLDGNNLCLLYGYGGFNISIQPTFSVTRIALMQNLDGIVAIPNIRGGGEYGEKWHNGGRLLNKQNGFDDFIAAGEYLVENKYTCPQKLAIQGGSNGGLLVGACANQRPDLFGAAIAHVGVMDMLRFHKFTIGYAWCSDYGCPDEKEHFDNLIKFSPLHNVRIPEGNDKQYPAVLLLTADHDDRVVPLHSYKFIAELQHQLGKVPQQRNPLMIRIDQKAGHGAGKPTAKIIEEHTDVLCFLVQTLDAKFHL